MVLVKESVVHVNETLDTWGPWTRPQFQTKNWSMKVITLETKVWPRYAMWPNANWTWWQRIWKWPVEINYMFSWNNTKSTIGRLQYSSQQWIPVSFHWHCWLKHSSACIVWVINFVLFLWNKRVYKVKTAICKWAFKVLDALNSQNNFPIWNKAF